MNNIDKVYNRLRGLAKSHYWQTIYCQGKELNGLYLFENTTVFTDIQTLFLNYLNFYYGLYYAITMDEVEEIVLKNTIYEDAFMSYRNKKNKITDIPTPIKNDKRDKKKQSFENKWVFKKPE